MKLSSPDFNDNELIPKRFTCQGEDVSPTLLIENLPANAKSLVLIVDDPDAPMGTWVHWVVYNIPVTDKIAEDTVPGAQCLNDFGRKDYGGPCPPSGTHRYFFKLYALDAEVTLGDNARKEDLEGVMKPHVIDKAQLLGLYKKN